MTNSSGAGHATEFGIFGINAALNGMPAGDARLMITHGVSGSGKSRLAQQLAEQAQALRLRSDVERKRLFGLGALQVARVVERHGGGGGLLLGQPQGYDE